MTRRIVLCACLILVASICKAAPCSNTTPSGTTITCVQSAWGWQNYSSSSVSAGASSTGAGSVSWGSNVAAGHVLAVFSGTNSSTFSSLTDNCNTGASSDSFTVQTGTNATVGFAVVGASGPCTVTAHYTSSSGNSFIIVEDLNGVNASTPQDPASLATPNIQTGTTSLISSSVTTVVSGDFIFGGTVNPSANSATYTAGAGFTLDQLENGLSTSGQSEYGGQSTAGTVLASFTANGVHSYETGIIAFQPGSSSVATPAFSLSTGTYDSALPRSTTITSGTSGATICWAACYASGCSPSSPAASTPGTCSAGTSLTNGGSVVLPVGYSNFLALATKSSSVNSSVATGGQFDVTPTLDTIDGVTVGSASGNIFSVDGVTIGTSAGNIGSIDGLLAPATIISGGFPWAPFLSSTQAINWSQSGVPGGIPSPSWTQSGSTIAATSGDRTSTIQAALNSCGTNHYVLLGAGTFIVNTSLSVPSYCALRGSGASSTTLDVHGTSGAPIKLGSGTVSYSPIAITNGSTAGSTHLVLASSGATLNGYLAITETNDNVIVDVRGGEGNCTWCDAGWTSDGHLASGQIVEVTNVTGTAITINPGLYRAYTNSPLAIPFTASSKYAGVENLQIYDNDTGYSQDVNFSVCAYCWVKGVEFNYTQGDWVDVYWGYRDEVRDSYMSNAYTHTSGNADNDISLLNKTSASLVENNIIERGHASILLSWGAAGNVIAYNYAEGGLDQGSQNFAIGGMGMHGAHPQFNLWEGNVSPSISPDEIWGSSAFNTMFRNWAEGSTISCLPLTGRSTVTCTPFGTYGGSGINGWAAFQASRAIVLSHLATHYNLIGNVAGSAAQNALLEYGNPTSHVAILQYPSSQIYDNTNYNMTFGYGESSDSGSSVTGCSGSTNPPCHSTNAYATAFLHGNYTYADNAVDNWVSGVTHTLPASFYRASKPGWWGSLPYPAIGPDITGAPGANGHAGLIPAQNCALNVIGDTEGGAGSPKTWSAAMCGWWP